MQSRTLTKADILLSKDQITELEFKAFKAGMTAGEKLVNNAYLESQRIISKLSPEEKARLLKKKEEVKREKQPA